MLGECSGMSPGPDGVYRSTNNSGQFWVTFPTPRTVQEFWYRFYTRWESGFTYDQDPKSTKLIYIFGYQESNANYRCTGPGTPLSCCTGSSAGTCTRGNINPVIQMWHSSFNAPAQIRNVPTGYTNYLGNGFADIYPNGISDGTWKCIEVHLKLNTPGVADGVWDFWIDGVNISHFSDVKYWRIMMLRVLVGGGCSSTRTVGTGAV